MNDYLLNLQNGTLDLSGDKPVFLSHSPDMLLSKICNAEYDPAADCKEWKKFLLEIMRDDKRKNIVSPKDSRAFIDREHRTGNLFYPLWKYHTKWKVYVLRNAVTSVGRLFGNNEAGEFGSKTKS